MFGPFFWIMSSLLLGLDLWLLLFVQGQAALTLLVLLQGLCSLAGWLVLQKQDFNLLFYVDAEVSKGEPVIREVWEEVVVILAACALIAPGLITDLLGLFWLLPSGRRLFFHLVDQYFSPKVK